MVNKGMKLYEVLGDPELWQKRRDEAIRIIRAEVDRRKKNLGSPTGEERREDQERRQEPKK